VLPSRKFAGQLGREYDLIIGGKRSKTSDKIRSINPAKPSEVVGVHQKASIEAPSEPAVNAALQAFTHWSRTSVEERASLLFRVADVMRERKLEFHGVAGLRSFEETWFEADADISEAIDFCEFYVARPCASPKSNRPCNCRASATPWPTFRSASAP